MFTTQDVQQFESIGITLEKAEAQVNDLKNGYPFLKIKGAAAIGNGILCLDDKEREQLIKDWREYLEGEGDIIKMVPASGAASRMFKDLFEFENSDATEPNNAYIEKFFVERENFAFYEALNRVCVAEEGLSIQELVEAKRYKDIVRLLLHAEGLNYGNLPKGLLQFHKYPQYVRTAFVEHLVEGALYTNNRNNEVKIHFTVSPEHIEFFKQHLMSELPRYEDLFKVRYHVTFSIQKPSTDTLAVGLDGMPFRNEDGTILFRPGGHGALIENLNDLDGDVIFIKNIDNVVPDRLKQATIDYKQVIAGLLVRVQRQIFGFLSELEDEVPEERLAVMLAYAEQVLCIGSDEAKNMSALELKEYLRNKFNRPIRICGMVKNEGEPGGGPYLTYNSDGTTSPQILESSQIDKNNQEAVDCMKHSTHFNPVDLVCTVRNYKGEKFNLLNYVDPKTGFISMKSKNGIDIQVLELPGLWNGAMSDWNTIFVEVPIETFNPVKSVNDLLRDQHR